MANSLDEMSLEELKEAMSASLQDMEETTPPPAEPPKRKRRKAFSEVPTVEDAAAPPVFRSLAEDEADEWISPRRVKPETPGIPEEPVEIEEQPEEAEEERPAASGWIATEYESAPYDPEEDDEEEEAYRHPGESERVLQYGAEADDYGGFDYPYEAYEDDHYNKTYEDDEEEEEEPRPSIPDGITPVTVTATVTKARSTEVPEEDPYQTPELHPEEDAMFGNAQMRRYGSFFQGGQRGGVQRRSTEPFGTRPAANTAGTGSGWTPIHGERRRRPFTMHSYNEAMPEDTIQKMEDRVQSVKEAPIIIKTAAPMQTEKERITRSLEDVIVEIDKQVTHERHLPHCRAYTNTAVIKKPTYQNPETGKNRKPLIVFLFILATVTSVAAGLVTNAYHFANNGANKALTPLQCLIRATIPEMGGDYNFSLLPLDTDYFFAGAGIVLGVFAFVGALIWVTASQNEQSRVGHEHGEKHIATASDVQKYKNRFMDQ